MFITKQEKSIDGLKIDYVDNDYVYMICKKLKIYTKDDKVSVVLIDPKTKEVVGIVKPSFIKKYFKEIKL